MLSFRRRLHGRRGLKFDWLKEYGTITASPPSRAAWIEMLNFAIMLSTRVGRRLHGRRGLKCVLVEAFGTGVAGRRLHGRRGLK